MLNKKTKKRHKLSYEILMLVALCFSLSLILFLMIVPLGTALIEEYCLQNDIVMDEWDWYRLDNTMFSMGFAVSCVFFIVMFFVLFGERLAYIQKIIAGVHTLKDGNYGAQVELLGNNDLTELAEAVNYLSESEQRIKEKEKRLTEEREELIRTLSHDIRTPLTSIMSYTELLTVKGILTEEEQREYLLLVSKKTAQIKELTDILLDGGHRTLEFFEDARLLFKQLADEFESELEDAFHLNIDLSALNAFSGKFDVGEMRRIFDNLISNIRKYAEPTETVALRISKTESGILIQQNNATKNEQHPSESYKMGLHSIRRIAQNYGGTTEIHHADGKYEIMISLVTCFHHL